MYLVEMFVFIFLRVAACSSLYPRHPVPTSLQSAYALWLQLFASLIPWRQTPYFTQLCPCSVQHTACQVIGCSELVFLLSAKICWPPTFWPGTLLAVEHWRDLWSCWQTCNRYRTEVEWGWRRNCTWSARRPSMEGLIRECLPLKLAFKVRIEDRWDYFSQDYKECCRGGNCLLKEAFYANGEPKDQLIPREGGRKKLLQQPWR